MPTQVEERFGIEHGREVKFAIIKTEGPIDPQWLIEVCGINLQSKITRTFDKDADCESLICGGSYPYDEYYVEDYFGLLSIHPDRICTNFKYQNVVPLMYQIAQALNYRPDLEHLVL